MSFWIKATIALGFLVIVGLVVGKLIGGYADEETKTIVKESPELKAQRDSLINDISLIIITNDSLLRVIDTLESKNKSKNARVKLRAAIDTTDLANQRDSAIHGWDDALAISAKKDTVIEGYQRSEKSWLHYKDVAESRITRVEQKLKASKGHTLFGIVPLPKLQVNYGPSIPDGKLRANIGLGYSIKL